MARAYKQQQHRAGLWRLCQIARFKGRKEGRKEGRKGTRHGAILLLGIGCLHQVGEARQRETGEGNEVAATACACGPAARFKETDLVRRTGLSR